MASRSKNICKYCDTEKLQNHNDTPIHKYEFYRKSFEEYWLALSKDRHGIVIKLNVNKSLKDNKNIAFNYTPNKGKYLAEILADELHQLPNSIITFQCSVINNRQDGIFLTNVNLLHDSKSFKLADTFDNTVIRHILPGCTLKFPIQFDGSAIHSSSFKIPLICNFRTSHKVIKSNPRERKSDTDSFTIARQIVVDIFTEKETNELIKSKSKFTKEKWLNVRKWIPPAVKMHYEETFQVPKEYESLLRAELKDSINQDKQVLYKILNTINKLTKNNYEEFWHILLWLEEMKETEMIQNYNMENAEIQLNTKGNFELKIHGLSEKRPSVIFGDKVWLREHDHGNAYQGIVHKVFLDDRNPEKNYIEIKEVNNLFKERFKANHDLNVDVSFALNRLSYMRRHEGVVKVAAKGLLVDMLFTNQKQALKTLKRPITLKDSDYLNPSIISNLEQKMSVCSIINKSHRFPYIVYGPPGTGKTITIVEAILQIKKHTSGRILVCAPTNSACDAITEKLIDYGKCDLTELIRINSESREKTTLTEKLAKYCKDNKYSDEKLMTFRIIITTLTLIGRYRGCYRADWLFIDEAAQASEPECDVAIGYLAAGGHLVLAGDPKQLGPIVNSKVAIEYKYDVTLMERLMEEDHYKLKDNIYNTDFITMLKSNFRSHRAILKIPNALFYNNQLQERTGLNDLLSQMAIYPLISKNDHKTGYPLEFCSVSSKNMKDGSSPSYFNDKERDMVLAYVKTLLTKLPIRIQQDEIGIITPYKRQVCKISTLLKNNNFPLVEVGTTESFQGREKRVIIISTVRAQHNLLKHDRKYNLGFVRDDKRFNVAVTRAMTKIILIGCKHVLTTDGKWKRFMEDCRVANCYYGDRDGQRDEEWKRSVVAKFSGFQNKDDQYNY